MRVLVVNSGSSSLKVGLVVDGVLGRHDNVPLADREDELTEVLHDWRPIDAVGVRFVHGGPDHLVPVRLDDGVLAELDRTVSLAPLHNPVALAVAREVRTALPGVPVVACFDTSFHRSIPAAAATYPLPAEWNRRWRLRRYGFHGLSHQYAVRRAAEVLGRPAEELRIVVAHLGAGASLCAVRGGRSVDTTMGFTPLEGLMMQVRSGSVDPGLLVWLQQQGVSLDELSETLEHRSGLAGLSGTSGDMKQVEAACAAGDPDARAAWAVYLHRLRRELGGMIAAAGGLDVLVFTGGIGEHSPRLRADVVEGLDYLGVALDPGAADAPGDRDIATAGSRARVLVVEAREDLAIAAEVTRLLGAGA
ncbi:acetate/propionate family kinase [Nocardioides insulae]|uniref:acetate/propionate family kinase n=1 Tax=Nocardioides insulae TaxID=394734 RepID=UPI0003FA517F|nr:acetate/propionate family kinase [Nocardioides insulae]